MTGRRAVHERTGKVLAEDLELASNVITLTAGLMFRSTLAPGRGLWLNPCNGIHMMFMRFAIDAVYIDRSGRVVKVAAELQPWRLADAARGARDVLELPAGTAARTGTQVGDELVFEPTP